MKLSYVKLSEAVRVNGKMALELHDGTASALGVVVPSEGGAVLVPWHAVRWAQEAPPRPEAPLDRARRAQEEALALGYSPDEAADAARAQMGLPPAEKPKRKR